MEENLIINSRAYKEAEREKANEALLKAKSLKRKVRRAPIGEDEFSREMKSKHEPDCLDANMLSVNEVCSLMNVKKHFFSARVKRDNIPYTLRNKRNKYFDKNYIIEYFKNNPYRFTK